MKKELKNGGDLVKVYSVILMQMMIWSLYTLLEWLSQHDHPIYNGIMFIVFLFIAMKCGNLIMKSTRKTLFTTLVSLGVYFSLYLTMSIFSI